MAVKNQIDEMWAGNRHVQRIGPITDEDAVGSPVKDLSVFALEWVLSAIDPATNLYSAEPLVCKTEASGITFPDGSGGVDGIVDVTLVAGDTSALAPGKYHFELEAFDATPEGVVLAEGTLTILSNVLSTC